MNPKLTPGKIIGLVVLGILIVLVLWLMSAYNSLVTLNENAKTAFADIDVQYQRRFDTIPNLVKTAEGIANLEKSVFTELAEARSKYAGAAPQSAEQIQALGKFDTALSRLMVIVENYPTLKSSESFLKLQDQIEGTENRIAVARNDYNSSVNQLNQKVQFFPSNLVARIFGFAQRELFRATQEAATTVPEVKFEFK